MLVFFNYFFDIIGLILNILAVFLSVRILMEFITSIMNTEPRRTQIAPFYEILFTFTEPVCIPFRNMIPRGAIFPIYVIMAIAWIYTLMEINTLIRSATLKVLGAN